MRGGDFVLVLCWLSVCFCPTLGQPWKGKKTEPADSRDESNMSSWIKIAGVSGSLAIALGAFGAHGLKGKVDEKMIKTWETAAHYHLVHSAALLAIAASGNALSKRAAKTTPPLMVAGMVLFSGSLYALVLTNKKALGAITPIGGLLLMGGWLALAL